MLHLRAPTCCYSKCHIVSLPGSFRILLFLRYRVDHSHTSCPTPPVPAATKAGALWAQDHRQLLPPGAPRLTLPIRWTPTKDARARSIEATTSSTQRICCQMGCCRQKYTLHLLVRFRIQLSRLLVAQCQTNAFDCTAQAPPAPARRSTAQRDDPALPAGADGGAMQTAQPRGSPDPQVMTAGDASLVLLHL